MNQDSVKTETENRPDLNNKTTTTKNAEDEDKNQSNYAKNLKISTSSGGLSLDGGKVVKQNDRMIEESKVVKKFNPLWRQCLASSAPILLTVTSGLTSGYSAILLPQLEKMPGPIHLDSEGVTVSWIASMAALSMALGCLIAGWMMEKFGRKVSLYIICVPILIGWIFIACAKSLTPMLIGRFLTGLCVGLLGPLVPVYVGETTEPKYRGFVLAAVSLGVAVGLFVSHLVGTFLSWQWTAISFTIFPVISAILLIFAPESPTWLISHGRQEEGVQAFSWLRGYSEEANNELKAIIDNQKAADAEPKMSLKDKITALKNPEFVKPLFIMILFFMTCQFSGVNAIAFYSITFVEKSMGKGGKSLDHYAVMMIIDTVRIVMSVVACMITKRYGRRTLCFVSGIWTSLSLAGLAMFLQFTAGMSLPHMSWIPMVFLISYICAISVGLVPLPWIMCGEVFPVKVRGMGSGISSAITFTSLFIVVKTAPGMMNHLGEIITFLIYGSVAAVGTFVMYFILPETRGKSLQEIEDKFKSNKRTDGKA